VGVGERAELFGVAEVLGEELEVLALQLLL